MNLLTTFVLAPVLGCAISFLITGSTAGYLIRLLGYAVLRYTKLDELLFCPSCLGTWTGFVTRHAMGGSILECAHSALVAYLLAAILQSAFGLAANDREQIVEKLTKTSKEGE